MMTLSVSRVALATIIAATAALQVQDEQRRQRDGSEQRLGPLAHGLLLFVGRVRMTSSSLTAINPLSVFSPPIPTKSTGFFRRPRSRPTSR